MNKATRSYMKSKLTGSVFTISTFFGKGSKPKKVEQYVRSIILRNSIIEQVESASFYPLEL
ncbi:hypothetical protein MACH09_31510 [Vibrio sp. MACH09]|nr:hypothetical protein MACH09_31510 [Vibrio sp. MACH09]